MKLKKKDSDLFFELMMPLLTFANERLGVVDPEKIDAKNGPKYNAQLSKIRDALWQNENIFFEYLEIMLESGKLAERELSILESWFFRHEGKFLVAKYEKSHVVFMDIENEVIFGVVGITQELSKLFITEDLPVLVKATLLPFDGKIITDELITVASSKSSKKERKSLIELLEKIQEETDTITNLNDFYDFEGMEELIEEVMEHIEDELLDGTAKTKSNKSSKNSPQKENKSRKAYELKVTIVDSKPPIWRKVIVPANYTFEDLHHVIQTIMDWKDYHLYEFECRKLGIRILDSEIDDCGDLFDEEGTHSIHTEISTVIETGKPIIYTYDFGDNWGHKIELKQVIENYLFDYSQVVKFKGDNIPEDCGGIWGYYNMKGVLSNPKHPEYEMIIDWYEGDESYKFDLEETNDLLRDLV